MNPIQTFRVGEGGDWRLEWIGTDGRIDHQIVRAVTDRTIVIDIPFIAFGELYLASINRLDANDMGVRKVDRSRHIVDPVIKFGNYISLITVQRVEDEREMAVFHRSYMFNSRIHQDITYYALIGKDGKYEYRHTITEKPNYIQYVYDVKLGHITTCQWGDVIHKTNQCIPYIALGDKLLMGTVTSTNECNHLRIIEADKLTGNIRVICTLFVWFDPIVEYVGDNVVVVCDSRIESDKSQWALYNLADGTSYQISDG